MYPRISIRGCLRPPVGPSRFRKNRQKLKFLRKFPKYIPLSIFPAQSLEAYNPSLRASDHLTTASETKIPNHGDFKPLPQSLQP